MDEHKVAFISCVNDEMEYAECRYYLERLLIPEGYSIDIIGIREATSMTSGYNAGMNDSDAKYKIYLHQDVFIINTEFISDILNIFACDGQIGMVGLVGKKKTGMTVFDMMKWDMGGVIYNNDVMSWEHPEKGCYAEAAVADGFLLATQYDIPWRDDIFDGWDFYDLSQCIEFRKKGYKVVIPYQKEIWCFHDGLFLDLKKYFDQYEIFLQEYSEIEHIPSDRSREELLKVEEQRRHVERVRELETCIIELMYIGEKKGLREAFQNPVFKNSPYLSEYDAIICIDQKEEQTKEMSHFWQNGMTASQLILKLRILKYVLKRIEYGADDEESYMILKKYSKHAVMEVCTRYTTCKELICEKASVW